jgi:flagellar basal body-associated protein FliL
MADEAAPVAEVPQPEAKKSKKGMLAAMLIVGGMMVLEGAALFALIKFTSPDPASAEAARIGGEDEEEDADASQDAFAEIDLGECRPTNAKTGRLITYVISVSILVKQEELEGAQKLAEEKDGRIKDRILFIVRSADPNHLKEPGLDTIRRRLRFELEGIFKKDGLIQNVLITQFLQSGTGL